MPKASRRRLATLIRIRQEVEKRLDRVAPYLRGPSALGGLLTPTLGEPPCLLGEFNTPDEPFLGFIRAGTFVPYTPLANMAGTPAISLPLSWNDEGLPIGSHLMAAYGREDLLLRVASQLETARPWADRRPPVHV